MPDTQRVQLLMALCHRYGAPDIAPDSALAAGRRAVAGARRLSNPKLLLEMLDGLGNAYGRAHRIPEALAVFLEQLQLAHRHRLVGSEALAYVALGNIYTEQENEPLAEQYYRRAVATAAQGASPYINARVLGMLGLYLLEKPPYRLAEAERLIQQALTLDRRSGDPIRQATSLSYLAECALRQGNYRKTVTYATESARLMPRERTYELACIYDLLSRASVKLHQLGEAASYSTQAVAFARVAQVPATEMELLDSLISIQAQRHDYAATYRLHRRTLQLHDSVFRQDRNAEVSRLLAQFDSEKKQHAIRSLTQQTRIQHLEVDRQRARLRMLGVVAAILAGALALVGFFFWKLRQSRQRLAVSEDELRRLNRTKDLLMSIIGHDLRGPIAAFHQVGHILRIYARRPDPTALTELADEVQAGAGRAGALLDNLLHWSRAQAGDVANHPEAISAEDAVVQVLDLYRPTAATKQLQLRTEVATGLPAAWADPSLLATVLRNLISNAVKFTPSGGRVTVSVQQRDTGAGVRLVFQVQDTGVGIAPAQLATLFQAGVARSTHGTAGEPGTGLGLAVSRAFVLLLGSELIVRSTTGEGTTFSFELPIGPTTNAPSPVESTRIEA